MSSQNYTETLLEELDEQDLGVQVEDPDADVPTLACASEDHNGEPIREGEQTVALLIRDEDTGWSITETFCGECSILDEYSKLDEEVPKAIVEGIIVPENAFGPSEKAHIFDGFLWELEEETA